MAAILSLGAGPKAKTVLEPAAICVLPASVITVVIIPAAFALSLMSSLRVSKIGQ